LISDPSLNLGNLKRDIEEGSEVIPSDNW